jgi:hypothetical protein
MIQVRYAPGPFQVGRVSRHRTDSRGRARCITGCGSAAAFRVDFGGASRSVLLCGGCWGDLLSLDPLLGTAEVAGYFDRSPDTVRGWVARGDVLPPPDLDGPARWRLSTIEDVDPPRHGRPPKPKPEEAS